MPCDRVNFPALLKTALHNQLALAECVADRSVADYGRRQKLVETCRANLAELDEFIAGYTVTIRKRNAAPRRCA